MGAGDVTTPSLKEARVSFREVCSTTMNGHHPAAETCQFCATSGCEQAQQMARLFNHFIGGHKY
jgi:hypothetical protein